MATLSTYVCAEYVFLDAWGVPRSKVKVVPNKTSIALEELGDWNFDGSSTGQAPGEDSEVIIKPRAIYSDPIRGPPHVLVMCDNWTPTGEPLPSNTRFLAAKVFDAAPAEVPWFGIEQEYILFKDGAPLGWPKNSARNGQKGGPVVQLGFPGPQGPYYCSAGADVAFGRNIVEEHLMLCTLAGLQISGINSEVTAGQWEFQVGPCVGIDAGDQHQMARYLLARVTEKHGVVVSYEPKPVVGVNGSGAHTNFSTLNMREANNALDKYIIPAVEKLGKRHAEHIANYGEGNEARLTGHHETASIDKFSWGVANRGASVRIGNQTASDKKGYFEDRRPAANMVGALCHPARALTRARAGPLLGHGHDLRYVPSGRQVRGHLAPASEPHNGPPPQLAAQTGGRREQREQVRGAPRVAGGAQVDGPRVKVRGTQGHRGAQARLPQRQLGGRVGAVGGSRAAQGDFAGKPKVQGRGRQEEGRLRGHHVKREQSHSQNTLHFTTRPPHHWHIYMARHDWRFPAAASSPSSRSPVAVSRSRKSS
jgi:glutamine synthetase